MANTSAMWQQIAHTTYQLSSPCCSTRATHTQKNTKMAEIIFWKNRQENGMSAERLEDTEQEDYFFYACIS